MKNRNFEKLGHHSNGLLFEIRQSIFILIHGFEYLLDGVAGQDDEVDQQKRPEDVNLDHFEISADEAKQEGEGCPLPYFDFAQGACQWLIAGVIKADSCTPAVARIRINLLGEGVQVFLLHFAVLKVLSHSSGRKIPDQELQQVEADKVSGDVIGDSLHSLNVGNDQDKSGGPSHLPVEHEPIDEPIVESPYLPDCLCNKHPPANITISRIIANLLTEIQILNAPPHCQIDQEQAGATTASEISQHSLRLNNMKSDNPALSQLR